MVSLIINCKKNLIRNFKETKDIMTSTPRSNDDLNPWGSSDPHYEVQQDDEQWTGPPPTTTTPPQLPSRPPPPASPSPTTRPTPAPPPPPYNNSSSMSTGAVGLWGSIKGGGNSIVRLLAVEGPPVPVQGGAAAFGNVKGALAAAKGLILEKTTAVGAAVSGNAPTSAGTLSSHGKGEPIPSSSSPFTPNTSVTPALLSLPSASTSSNNQYHIPNSAHHLNKPVIRQPHIFYLNHAEISLILEPPPTTSTGPILVIPHTRLPHKYASPLFLPRPSTPSDTTPDDPVDTLIRNLSETSTEPFAVFPLADHASGGTHAARHLRRVIVNARYIVAVHAFKPSEVSLWTTIVVKADVTLPQSSIVALESSGGGGERSVMEAVMMASGVGVYSFEVGMPLLEVLKSLEGGSWYQPS
ncbi:hypothetical protein BC829DRAFT_400344 [Chytridium lagenaria]|nr:hypothetical protein BC829DRAFT_400344 [Chytridium lagenaria]